MEVNMNKSVKLLEKGDVVIVDFDRPNGGYKAEIISAGVWFSFIKTIHGERFSIMNTRLSLTHIPQKTNNMNKIDYEGIWNSAVEKKWYPLNERPVFEAMKETLSQAIPIILEHCEKELDNKLREIFDKANKENYKINNWLGVQWVDIANKLVDKESITSQKEELFNMFGL